VCVGSGRLIDDHETSSAEGAAKKGEGCCGTEVGLELRHRIGVENSTWECDYPPLRFDVARVS
jgi:hypothetical protein